MASNLTLYPSKHKTALFLIWCLLFTIVGFVMVAKHQPAGWYVLLVSAFGGLILLAVLLPGSTYLLISESGFETKTLFKRQFYPWRDTLDFVPGKHFGLKTVFIVGNLRVNFKNKDNNDLRISFPKPLPDTYGKSPEELARILSDSKFFYEKYQSISFATKN